MTKSATQFMITAFNKMSKPVLLHFFKLDAIARIKQQPFFGKPNDYIEITIERDYK